MIRPGEPWGSPTSSPPDLEVAGGDAALAAAVTGAPGALVRFRPDETSDLARAVGLGPGASGPPAGTALPMDALSVADNGSGASTLVCNMCVLGTPPDRVGWSTALTALEVLVDDRPWFSGPASTVVIANGQFLRGADLVPRGHPGDGRAEIQVYALERRERRAMRARLATGAHLPHPRIQGRTGHRIEVRSSAALAVEADRVARPAASGLRVEVVPSAYRLLV